MKRLLTLAAAILLAAPLAAADGDQTAKKKSEEEAAKKAAAAKQAAPAPAQEDSPLVAAAKRSKRLGKNPTNVITNETVGSNKSGGAHITTTETQAELPAATKPDTPRRSLADMERERITREQEAKRLADDVASKRQRLAALEAQAAESLGIDEDPAAAEAALETAKKELAEAEKKAEAAKRRP